MAGGAKFVQLSKSVALRSGGDLVLEIVVTNYLSVRIFVEMHGDTELCLQEGRNSFSHKSTKDIINR